MGEELFNEHFSAGLVGEPKIAKDLSISLVNADVVEEAGNVRHEGDGMLAEAGEDVDERIDEIWAAEKEVVEADSVDVGPGVVAHPYFSILIHCVHREVPAGEFGIHFVVGDVDGESFIVKFLHFGENALFEDRITLESWNH